MTPDIVIAAGTVRLRQMRAEDAGELRRIVTIPEVGRMLFLFPAEWSVPAAREFIGSWCFRGSLPFRLAVSAEDGRFLGSVGASAGPEPEVFYFLDPEVAGHGVMTAAMQAFVRFLFARFDISALGAGVFTDNPGSARVLEKLGFVRTGEGIGTSAQRLEPAPIWKYRLRREAFAE